MSNLSNIINLAISNQVFAIHTDTVYGLCGSANSKSAIKKLKTIKQRTDEKPGFSLHISNISELGGVIIPSQVFHRLSETLLPGPVTLIAQAKEGIYQEIQNNGKLGIRIPNCEFCLNIIKTIGIPIVATSANGVNELPATLQEEIEEICTKYSIPIPSSCACMLGIDSTVIDTTGDIPIILRRGATPINIIKSAAGTNISISPSASYNHLRQKLARAENRLMEGNIAINHKTRKNIKLILEFTDQLLCQCQGSGQFCSSIPVNYPLVIKNALLNSDEIRITFHGARITDEEWIEILCEGPKPSNNYPYSNHDFLFQSVIMIMRAMVPIS